jgi:sarcosine oxidase delta subunit
MFPEIDWTRPWYDTVRPAFESLTAGPFMDAFNANAARLGLVNQSGQALRFVPQADLPEGMAYEAFIGATGCVPTRANLHDFFNGLVWQTFPCIKRELNALQAAQIAQAGVGKSRGPARDAATIFDENAALLVVHDDAAGHALVDDLRAHRWRAALFDRRAMFGRAAEVWLFGHALMEKLVAPRKAITAHVRVVFAAADFFARDRAGRRDWIDTAVSKAIAAEGLSTAGFTPLPVLGVPGWWPDQDEAFYLDATVFRPKRPVHHHP